PRRRRAGSPADAATSPRSPPPSPARPGDPLHATARRARAAPWWPPPRLDPSRCAAALHLSDRMRAARRLEHALDVGEQPGAPLQELARARVDRPMHHRERGGDGEIRAADAVGVEEGPLAEQLVEVVEAVLELGARPAAARVEDVRVQVAARVDHPEPREGAERESAADGPRRARAGSALGPAPGGGGGPRVAPPLR